MEGQQLAVGGHVDVGLDVSVAERNGVRERRHGVLRGLAGPTAVGEGDRPGPVQEGEDGVGGHGRRG